MGLDLVELTIRIEDTFAVQIPDRIAPELTTPRKVTDFILTQVEEARAPLPCLSQKAFYLLREGFVETLSLPRRDFRPGAQLKAIVPEENRIMAWESVGLAVGAKKWPTVFRPKLLSFLAPRLHSVRDSVGYLVTNEPWVVKGQETAWSRAQVCDVLRRVIRDETGVVEFTEDSRFVEDVRLD